MPFQIQLQLFAHTVGGVSVLHDADFVRCNIKPLILGVVSPSPASVTLDVGLPQLIGIKSQKPLPTAPGHGGTWDKSLLRGRNSTFEAPADMWSL